MARYEHVPIYKTAMDLAVYLEQVGFSGCFRFVPANGVGHVCCGYTRR